MPQEPNVLTKSDSNTKVFLRRAFASLLRRLMLALLGASSILCSPLGTAAARGDVALPAGGRGGDFQWGLQLPGNPVFRRIARNFRLSGNQPVVLGELQGPGCIRRLWVTGSDLELPHAFRPLGSHRTGARRQEYRPLLHD